jgi:hypothetical protein
MGEYSSEYSSEYDVGGAPTNVLTFGTQPTTGVTTVALGTIVVTSDDGTFTGNVTLTIATGSGSLSGTTVVAAVAGVATFTNVIITGTGAHTLQAAASGHAVDISDTITVAAIALSVVSQPTVAYNGYVMGNVVIASNNPASTATVTIAKQSGSGTLSGTTAKAMTAGVVTFDDLQIAGTGAHVLRATATGHTLVDLSSFTVLDEAPPVIGGGGSRRRRRIAAFHALGVV